MKNVMLGLIVFLLLGIFVFLGMIYVNQTEEPPEEAVADSKEETTSEETSEEKSEEDKESTEEESEKVEESKRQDKSVEDEEPEEETETSAAKNKQTTSPGDMTAEKLEEELMNQELVVEDEEYIIQDSEYKNLYPDMLSAIIRNNSNVYIKNMTYGFVAWDKNGLPVRLKGDIDFSDGSYFHGGTGEAINVAPGEVHGRDYGFGIDSDIDNIHTLKAIAVSYEGFNGESWENPYLNDFLDIYEGKRLADIEGHEEFIYNRDGSTSTVKPEETEVANSTESHGEHGPAAEAFINEYLNDLQLAYTEDDFSYVENYLESGSGIYNTLRNNVKNQNFPNMQIWAVEVTEYSEEGNQIYMEVSSERTHDNLEGTHVFVTGYDLVFQPENDTFIIKNFTDL